jgi:hypothetical protein
MRIVGVDPGALGAIALVVGATLESVHDMPILKVRRGKGDKSEVDGYTLAALVRELKADIAYVEQVGGITGQSASAAFNFGRACGAVEYAFKALGVRVEMVPPGTWKKALKIKPGKDDSRAAAMRFWPAQASLFQRKKDDGRAEAGLVAEWGRLQQNGGTNVFT